MQTRAKFFVSILLATVLLVCSAITAFAVEPRYSDTNSITVTLVFGGTTAYCDAKVTGADGTTSITNGHLVLTDSNGSVAAEWKDLSVTGKKFTLSETVSGLTKGETYTLTFSAKVNRNGVSEDVSNYVSKTCK